MPASTTGPFPGMARERSNGGQDPADLRPVTRAPLTAAASRDALAMAPPGRCANDDRG